MPRKGSIYNQRRGCQGWFLFKVNVVCTGYSSKLLGRGPAKDVERPVLQVVTFKNVGINTTSYLYKKGLQCYPFGLDLKKEIGQYI